MVNIVDGDGLDVRSHEVNLYVINLVCTHGRVKARMYGFIW